MRAAFLLLFVWCGLLDFAASSEVVEVVPGTIDDPNSDEGRNWQGPFGLFGNNNNNNNEEEEETDTTDAKPGLGERCGLLASGLASEEDRCEEGLECSHSAAIVGRRCTPRKECVRDSLQSVLGRPQFQGDNYKNRILSMANVTEMDVFNAMLANPEDLEAFTASEPVQAIRNAIDETVSEFDDLGPLMKRCVEPEHNHHDERALGLFDDDETDDGTDPTQGDGQFPVVFIGIHLEGGAGVDASFSTVWQVVGGAVVVNQRVAGRVCAGVEIGAGIELSFIVAVGFTNDARSLNCLQVLIDFDVEVFFGLGIGYGFCVPNPATKNMYVEVTIGAGVGGGLGASACWIFPFV